MNGVRVGMKISVEMGMGSRYGIYVSGKVGTEGRNDCIERCQDGDEDLGEDEDGYSV